VKRLRLTPEAELDLDEAHLWHHRQAPRLAADFLATVNASLASIQRHPEAYALVDPTMRRALARRFPYAIFYEVETPRLRCMRSSTVPGILARGDADGTGNFAVERTRFARRSPRRYANHVNDSCHRKSRELIADLQAAGFADRGGKGSHRNFVHLKVARPVTISGALGDDAKRYQVRAVQLAIEESKK
jgi:plasmid stabilization system protein ParE/predicted RNA binding protein YcfA (HicA-like mRNA interferase family)